MTPEEIIRKCNNFGRFTLQLSECEIHGDTIDFSSLPDGWIYELQHRGCTLAPCIKGERGYTFLTKAGYENNIPLIKSIVKNEWPKFEQKTKEHFEKLEKDRLARQRLFERKALLYKEAVI